MKKSLILVLAAVVVGLSLGARADNTLTADEQAAGWRLLFDGASTAGWRSFQKQTFPVNAWMVENGTLKCDKTGPRGGDIITTQLFTNFEFACEWKIAPGANSGVKYFVDEKRTDKKGKLQTAAVAHEYQILDDDAPAWAKLHPQSKTGSFYEVLPPAADKTLKPVGEWNSTRIVVQGKHVEHWLNGVKVVEYETDGAAAAQGIAASKFKDVPGFADKIPTPLLLQDHGGGVWFRNLKARELPLK